MRGGAAVVVYLDVLFFTNVLMDWVTLLAAARLGGAKVRQGRLALASLLGGVYAAGAALLPLLAALPVRVLAGAALCLAAFHLNHVGKPAPPRPASPEVFISSMTCSGVIVFKTFESAVYPPYFS